MPSNLKIAVQNALIALGQTGKFYPVTYSETTKLAACDLNTLVVPSTVLANEISSSFAISPTNRRTYQRDRAAWTWHLNLAFEVEVNLEVFEREVSDTPPRVLRDLPNGIDRQVTLELVSTEPRHPVTQESSVGTEVKFVFEARMSPAPSPR